MKRLKSILSNKAVFGVLLTLALCLLCFSGVKTSQAALTYVSEYYAAEMTVSSIGITLTENEADISSRDYAGSDNVWNETQGVLLGNLLAEDESFQIGTEYPERITVRNSGNIDEYVRVIILRYWTDSDGTKRTDLAPDLIDLHVLEGSGWLLDESASTPERMVFYYSRILPVGATAPDITDTIRVDGSLAENVTTTETVNDAGQTVIKTEFMYNGVRMNLEAEADGVQTHNAQEAIKSAWGVDAVIDAAGGLSIG